MAGWRRRPATVGWPACKPSPALLPENFYPPPAPRRDVKRVRFLCPAPRAVFYGRGGVDATRHGKGARSAGKGREDDRGVGNHVSLRECRYVVLLLLVRAYICIALLYRRSTPGFTPIVGQSCVHAVFLGRHYSRFPPPACVSHQPTRSANSNSSPIGDRRKVSHESR